MPSRSRHTGAALLALLLSGCLEELDGACSTCEGSSFCYASCMCSRQSDTACRSECSDAPPELAAQAPPDAAEVAEVIELTNQARASGACCGANGCFDAVPALDAAASLNAAAQRHAVDMAARDYFEHQSPEGYAPLDRVRIESAMYCAVGENIAFGQPTPAAVVQAWLESPGHCANLMEPAFSFIGVGIAADADDRLFWVQNFGGN